MPKIPDTIYVRIDPELKAFLGQYAEEKELSERSIIESLLGHFRALTEDGRTEILESPGSRLGSVGAVIELIAWCDHAFLLKNWEWAIEAYHVLLRQYAQGSKGLRRLAHYKLGYCWIDMALGLRLEALISFCHDVRLARSSPTWLQTFDAAEEAVRRSLLHNDHFIELGGHHPIVRYGSACAWSLLAQYAVEKALMVSWLENQEAVDRKYVRPMFAPVPVGPASSIETDEQLAQARSVDDSFWSEIGSTWREQLRFRPERVLKDVQTCSTKAIRELDNIFNDEAFFSEENARYERFPPVDKGYFARKASTDSDLIFVRYDGEAKTEFAQWMQGKGARETKFETFRRISLEATF